jgi:hypothetical protein
VAASLIVERFLPSAAMAAAPASASSSAALDVDADEPVRYVRKREIDWWYISPLAFTMLPLIRIGLRCVHHVSCVASQSAPLPRLPHCQGLQDDGSSSGLASHHITKPTSCGVHFCRCYSCLRDGLRVIA